MGWRRSVASAALTKTQWHLDKENLVPDISLLQPTVFRGVVERFTAPENKPMLSRVPKTPWPYPTAEWDVLRGSRAVARYNVVNSEAHIVDRLGRSHETASFVHLREKKIFDPTTLQWIREPGQLAAANAEKAVMRELRDLNTRFDNRVELDIWQALSGSLRIEDSELGHLGTVDYKFLPTHKPDPSADWSEATPAQIVADVKAWKRLVERDGGVRAVEAWTSNEVLDYIFNSFATKGDTGSNFAAAALLSDRMKEQYYTTGKLPAFMNLDWNVNESVYDATGSAYGPNPTNPSEDTPFLGENSIILGNFTDNRPIELFEGLIADHDAPAKYTGKFAKTFREPDPSELQYLLAYSYLPVILRPEQFVAVGDVTADQ